MMDNPKRFKDFIFQMDAIKWVNYTNTTTRASTLIIGIDGQAVSFSGPDADELWRRLQKEFDTEDFTGG